jgi:predicted nucleic acid-binding protein
MKHLLDVSVLLAAIVETHTQHTEAWNWLQGKSVVLCPISELGFLRIGTNKSAIGLSMEKTREALTRFAADRNASRISDDLAALDSHPKSSGAGHGSLSCGSGGQTRTQTGDVGQPTQASGG